MNVVAQQDRSLVTAVAIQSSYARQVSDVKAPIINSFYDVSSTAYDRYTTGSVVRLKGKHLRFNPAAVDEGVFVDDGTTDTRLVVYSVVGDRQIDALVPTGISGDLTVTIRTHYTPGGDLRQSSYQRQVSPA